MAGQRIIYDPKIELCITDSLFGKVAWSIVLSRPFLLLFVLYATHLRGLDAMHVKDDDFHRTNYYTLATSMQYISLFLTTAC